MTTTITEYTRQWDTSHPQSLPLGSQRGEINNAETPQKYAKSGTENRGPHQDYDGFIEKYVGDGITALFGIGKNQQQSVSDAINCGLTILTEIYYAVNGYLESINLPKFSCSIGIDYGNIWVARVGIQGMNQLTLVGNEVSIAKQLEEFAGIHQIFLGATTYNHLSETDKSYCRLQKDRDDFRWYINNKKYSFYRYAAHRTGYELK